MDPVHLILSRKGFDGTAGGGASPILADGRMLSLPIPEPIAPEDGPTFGSLHDVDGTDYLALLGWLGYDAYDERSVAHLDPDLVPTIRPRKPGWRGMLGQVDAAASHLVNQGVGPGDLFLFWGLFAHNGPTGRFRGQRTRHAVYGYLEVGEVVDAGAGETVATALYHPHFSPGFRGRQNRVYVATDRLSRDRSRPGWGVFRWSPSLTLTAPHSSGLTTWQLPECFHPSTGTTLTYHGRSERWSEPDGSGHVTVERRGRGQEFVCVATEPILEWVLDLITTAPLWAPDRPG